MRVRSAEEFLRELKERGARRLKTVRFRANRSTIWSLTQDATVLNVHVAYRRAPGKILDAFATIVRGRGYRTARVKAAAECVRNWQGLGPVMDRTPGRWAIPLIVWQPSGRARASILTLVFPHACPLDCGMP